MKKAACFLIAMVFVLALPAAAETWSNASVLDTMCSVKAKAAPDSHPTKCALSCAKSGFGILTADGTYLKFDEAGNNKVVAALKETRKTDHLRVTVTGERDGDTIKVQSLKLE